MRFPLLLTLFLSSTMAFGKNCTEEDVKLYMGTDDYELFCDTLTINNPIIFFQDFDVYNFKFKPVIIRSHGEVIINSEINLRGFDGSYFLKSGSFLDHHTRPGPGGVPGRKFTDPNCSVLQSCFTTFYTENYMFEGMGHDGVSDFASSNNVGGSGASLRTYGEVPTNENFPTGLTPPNIVDFRTLIHFKSGGRPGGASFYGMYYNDGGGLGPASFDYYIALGGGGGGYLEISAPKITITSSGVIDVSGGHGINGAEPGFEFQGSGSGGGSGGVVYLNTSHFINVDGGQIIAQGGNRGNTFGSSSTNGGRGGSGYIIAGYIDGDYNINPQENLWGDKNWTFQQPQNYFSLPPEQLDSQIESCGASRKTNGFNISFIAQLLCSFALLELLSKLRIRKVF